VTPDYLKLVQGYASGEPTLLSTEAAYKPGFVNTNLSAVGQVQPNWLNLYTGNQPTVAGSDAALNTFSRTANTQDVATIGPAAAGAVRGVNPGQSALIDSYTQTASTDLAAGSQLAPTDIKRVTDRVRGDWASRGLGTSQPAQLNEAVDEATQGENLRLAREQAAGGAIAANQDITLPALGLTTPASPVPGQSADLLTQEAGFAGAAGPTLIPGNTAYDIFNTSYNAHAAAQIASANNNAAVVGAALSY
jgi:hypothetical protein